MRILAIVNPNSQRGKGKHIIPVMKERLARSLVRIEQNLDSLAACALAREAALDSIDTIVAVGGDGTINGIINGIVGTRAALGIIPRGTANDLAASFHLPEDIDRACDVIAARHVRRIDVIDVNGHCYVTAGGVGVSSEACRIANSTKQRGAGKLVSRLLGSNVYPMSALYAMLKGYGIHLAISDNGNSSNGRFLALMVNNQGFLGRGLTVSPGAINDDGMFDVCLIEALTSPWHVLELLACVMRGTHMRLPYVKTWRSETLVVHTDKPTGVLGDGEISPASTEFCFKIRPRALQVIVPPEASQ